MGDGPVKKSAKKIALQRSAAVVYVYLSPRFLRNHPHVCGEHRSLLSEIETVMESPPRMWGTLIEVILVQSSFGITPTYVGNTLFYIVNVFLP